MALLEEFKKVHILVYCNFINSGSIFTCFFSHNKVWPDMCTQLAHLHRFWVG